LPLFLLATPMTPVLQHGQLTLQTDLSSCGVCVPYTIDEIASRSLNLHHAPFCVDDFRAWMAYALTQASTTCHIWIKQFLENHNIAKPGLPNASNNCWFNSVVQGIQSIVSCSSTRKSLQMDSHTGPSLEQLVEDLALKICVENEVFENVFTAVCQGMGWDSKSQRDVTTKLFMLYDFKTLLQRFGIVSEFQFETHKTCGSCRAN